MRARSTAEDKPSHWWHALQSPCWVLFEIRAPILLCSLPSPWLPEARHPTLRPLQDYNLLSLMLGLTQSDFRLHGHGQSWVLDLTAEEGLVVNLRVEGPGEQGSHLHRAIAAWGAAVA